MTRSVRFLVGLLLAIGLMGLRPLPGFAASTVSDCPINETGLQNDISSAGNGGTVLFTCASPTIIPFTSTITLSQGVTLDGSGASGPVTFDGGGTTKLFVVNGGVALTLKGLTLAHGSASSGAAIENKGGTVTIITSTLSGNSAYSGRGGAIYNNAGTVAITTSTLSDNTASVGGAIANDFGTVTVTSSTLSGNSAPDGGAILNNSGAVTIVNSTFSGNSAPGGGSGGAIDNGVGTVTIGASTFSGNAAQAGGAIGNNSGTVSITSSTLSGNSASILGGAIYNVGPGGDIFSPATVRIGGSIVANSMGGGNCYNDGTITDAGYNLSDDSSCGFSSANHDLTNTNPQLGPLASNGGPTETMALLSTSPAIDVIPTSDVSLCPASGTDQRGYRRPDAGESYCDIGAYESAYLATTTTLASSADPSVVGQTVTYTATVSPIPDGGTVSFADGGAAISGCGSQPVNASTGQASCQVTYSSVESHTITASYTGNATYTFSSSSPLTQTVNKASPSLTSTATPGQGTEGATLKDSATLSSGYSPTGTITFTLHQGSCTGTVLDTETVSVSGNGSYSTPTGYASTQVGSYDWQASYSGDANNTGVTSACEAVTVNQAGSSTKLSSSANPSVSEQPVTFTATVTAGGSGLGTPTGSVQFAVDGTNVGSPVPLNSSGQASLSLSTLGVGSHTISASYSGDGTFSGSSDTLSQQVNKAGTSMSVSSSANPSTAGQTVTFTATVRMTGSGAGTPTGTVQFSIDGSPFGSPVALNGSGQATSPGISTLSPGVHTVTASYSGDSTFAGSSGSLTQQVSKASTTTTLTSSANPSPLHGSVTFTATVTSPGGVPTGTVTFTEGGITLATVPLDSTGKASFTTSSLGVGTHTITATYSGSSLYTGSSASLQQQVGYSICPIQLPFQGVTSGHIKIKLQLCDAAGNDLSSPTITLTVVGVSPNPGVAPPSGTFSFIPLLGGPNGGYQYSVNTYGYRIGTYTLLFTVAGDPVIHQVQFTVT